MQQCCDLNFGVDTTTTLAICFSLTGFKRLNEAMTLYRLGVFDLKEFLIFPLVLFPIFSFFFFKDDTQSSVVTFLPRTFVIYF